jgi:hypothetical protein
MLTGPGQSPEGLGGQGGSTPRYLLIDVRQLGATQLGDALGGVEWRGVSAVPVPEGFATALGRLAFQMPEVAIDGSRLATLDDLWHTLDPRMSDRGLKREATAIWNMLSDIYWRRFKAAQDGMPPESRDDVEELTEEPLSLLFLSDEDGEQYIDVGVLHAMLVPLPGRGTSIIADFGVFKEERIKALSAFVNEQLKLENGDALPT